MDRSEARRRQSLEDGLLEFILSRPMVWVPMRELNQFGAWRSRLPYVRRRLKAANLGAFTWNKRNGAASAYVYTPYVPLGRPAHEYIDQVGLF